MSSKKRYHQRKRSNSFEDFKVFLASDYSQIEVRILAEISGDKMLLKDFLLGEDIHCVVGHNLTGLPLEVIKKDKVVRTKIKAIHFAIIYGKNVAGVTADLIRSGIKTTEREVQKQFDKYFGRYKGVAKYIKKSRKRADETGFADTMFGFRREISRISDRSSSWMNQAINSPIQGTAHQLLLIGMAALRSKKTTFPHISGKLLMEVHDELTFRIKLKYLRKAYKETKKLMEVTIPQCIEKWFKFKLKVPLKCDIKVGFRRGVMIDYTGESIRSFLKKWRIANKEVSEGIQENFKKKYNIRIKQLV